MSETGRLKIHAKLRPEAAAEKAKAAAAAATEEDKPAEETSGQSTEEASHE